MAPFKSETWTVSFAFSEETVSITMLANAEESIILSNLAKLAMPGKHIRKGKNN